MHLCHLIPLYQTLEMLTKFKTRLFAAREESGEGEEKEKGKRMEEEITGEMDEGNW